MSEIGSLIKVNAETLPLLVKGYHATIHGDWQLEGKTCWDVEFKDMFNAASFASTMRESNDVESVDIGLTDVSSLDNPVTLTIVLKKTECPFPGTNCEWC